jgi:hypothetical protein
VYFTFANLSNHNNLEQLFSEGLDKKYSFRTRFFTEEEISIYLNEIGYSDIEIKDNGHQIIAVASKR